DEANENAHQKEQARRLEEGHRRRAEENADESRRRLGRLCVANGVRHLDENDVFGALVWFAEALRQESGDGRRETMHRTRLAAVLRQCPRRAKLGHHDKPVYHADISPDGRYVVTTSGDLHFMSGARGEARIWDAATGRPVTPPLKHIHPVYYAAFSPDSRLVVTACAGDVPVG